MNISVLCSLVAKQLKLTCFRLNLGKGMALQAAEMSCLRLAVDQQPVVSLLLMVTAETQLKSPNPS